MKETHKLQELLYEVPTCNSIIVQTRSNDTHHIITGNGQTGSARRDGMMLFGVTHAVPQLPKNMLKLPEENDGYLYYMRYVTDGQFPIYCRRKANLSNAAEEERTSSSWQSMFTFDITSITDIGRSK